jgi:uncharacterized repeat protein (TIGR02543 family)
VNWTGTGGFTGTDRTATVTNVTANMTVTAHYAINQYTVTFVTDGTPGATLTGTESQTISHGGNCAPVTANVPAAYHFVNWTGTGGFTGTDRTVTVTNVTANMTVTAHYAISQYTVSFVTDGTPGATLTGTESQPISHGGNCTPVTANVPTGYHFVNWTGTGGFTSTDRTVTVTNVIANMTVTAHYAINQYTVSFVTDGTSGATLTGTESQTISHGGSCAPVTANVPTGYHFVNWTGTGGFTSADRTVTVTSVTQPMTITAHYAVLTCAQVSLLAPVNGAAFSRVGTLRWNAVISATYDVQVATDSGFGTVVASATGVTMSEWKITPVLPPASTLYWRVRAVVSGVACQWSETWSFTTYQALPCGNCT